VNSADLFEGTFTGYSYGFPVSGLYGDAAEIRDSMWSSVDMADPGGMASPAGVMGLAGLAYSSSTITTGSNIAVNTAGSNIGFVSACGSSTVAMTGYGPPAPEPLVIRRFYHWNKSATAGSASRPDSLQEDAAYARPFLDAEVAESRDTVQVTENAAIQVVEDRGVQESCHSRRRHLMGRMVLSPRSLTSVALAFLGP
jgi:hypothetical protein